MNNARTTGFTVAAIAAIAVLVWLTFFNKKHGSASKTIATPAAPKPIGPYSQGILRGNALFVSGQIALIPGTDALDTADIATETKRVMQNVSAILAEAQMSTDNIAKTTIYVTSLDDFNIINATYAQFFLHGVFPARETVQVAALPKGAHVEISVMATK